MSVDRSLKTLQGMMQAELPEGGVAIPDGRNTHVEVVDVATGQVWMSVEPATKQDYDSLRAGLDDSLRGEHVYRLLQPEIPSVVHLPLPRHCHEHANRSNPPGRRSD